MKEWNFGEGSNTSFQFNHLDPKELLRLNKEEKRYFQEFASKVAMGNSQLYKAFISVISDINVRKRIKEGATIEEIAEYISDRYYSSFYEIANFLERFLEHLEEFRKESGERPREIYMGLGMVTVDQLFRLGKEGAEEVLSLLDEYDSMRALQILNDRNAPIIYVTAAFNGDAEVAKRAIEKVREEYLTPTLRYAISFIHRFLFNEDPGIDISASPKDPIAKVWRSLSLIFNSLKEAKKEMEGVSLEELFGLGPWSYSFGKGIKFLITYMEGNLHEIAEEMREILEQPSPNGPNPKCLLMIMLLNTMAEISEESKLESRIREFVEMLEICRNCPLRSLMAATVYHLNSKGATKMGPPPWFSEDKFPGIRIIGEIKRAESSMSLAGIPVEIKVEDSVFPYFRILKEYCVALKLCCGKRYEEGKEKLEDVIHKLESRGYLKKATEAKMMLVKCLVEMAKRERVDKGKFLREAQEVLEEIRERLENMRKQKMLNEVEDYREMIEHLLRLWEMSHR